MITLQNKQNNSPRADGFKQNRSCPEESSTTGPGKWLQMTLSQSVGEDHSPAPPNHDLWGGLEKEEQGKLDLRSRNANINLLHYLRDLVPAVFRLWNPTMALPFWKTSSRLLAMYDCQSPKSKAKGHKAYTALWEFLQQDKAPSEEHDELQLVAMGRKARSTDEKLESLKSSYDSWIRQCLWYPVLCFF